MKGSFIGGLGFRVFKHCVLGCVVGTDTEARRVRKTIRKRRTIFPKTLLYSYRVVSYIAQSFQGAKLWFKACPKDPESIL